MGIPSKPTKLHVGSFIERATGENILQALHYFLPSDFYNHMREVGGCDLQGYRMMLYMLVRKYQPKIVVETGVARGASSAYILCAMRENGFGHLYSIDLPAQKVAVEENTQRESHRYTLSDGQTHKHYEIGHRVPDYLKDKWTLILQDSKIALPELMQQLGSIDFFYHDSLHTFEHMQFEFDTAWPHINPGGLLLSDDVLWNRAYHDACAKYGKKPIVYRSFGMMQK
jgi:predicted O-methyltransferase YrrM